MPTLAIMGPTASGKTDLVFKLAEKYPIEVISVDSAMIYRDMNIGTAKPTEDELKKVPHQLVDILDPLEAYSAADFVRDAMALIDKAYEAGKMPVLVGGTMMYYRALFYGLSDLPSADAELREKLQGQLDSLGAQAMHDKLREIDPVAADRIHVNDPQRLLRALEVYELTGKPLSELQNRDNTLKFPYPLLKFAISPATRAEIHERVAQRYQIMMEQGLLDEVKALYQRGDLHLDLPSIRCVGYRQLWLHLDGEWDLEMAVEKSMTATRQLAKRQMTWLRSEEDLEWLVSDDPKNLERVIAAIGSKC